ncbi:MAG TPA: hypothetical protein VF723_10285 [Pyrinomonadaceae bacterium]|jgi:hypothetical protein
MKFQKKTIRDPAVMNIDGATLLLPEGWKGDGGFVWDPQSSTQANLLIRVSEPNIGAVYESLPSQQFSWLLEPSFSSLPPGSNWLGATVFPPPRDAAECVQVAFMSGALQHLRGAYLVQAEDLPGYTAELGRNISPTTVQTARLRYAFDVGGGPYEEDVYVVMAFFQQLGPVSQWWCGGSSMRAPAGELDRLRPLLSVPMLSLRRTFDWSALLDFAQVEFQLNIKKQQALMTPSKKGQILANFQTPAGMWAERQDEIRRKHKPTWEMRLPASERENSALAQIIGGLTSYVNPFDSRRVELPSEYSAYWMSKEGHVVGSNDAAFDPSAGSTAEWKKMSPYAADPQQQQQQQDGNSTWY